MNAEFLEQKIIIKNDTIEGESGTETVTTISPTTVRKGLHPGSFIGVEVNALADGVLVYACSIVSASAENGKVVFAIPGSAGRSSIEYNPVTGELAFSVHESSSGGNI